MNYADFTTISVNSGAAENGSQSPSRNPRRGPSGGGGVKGIFFFLKKYNL